MEHFKETKFSWYLDWNVSCKRCYYCFYLLKNAIKNGSDVTAPPPLFMKENIWKVETFSCTVLQSMVCFPIGIWHWKGIFKSFLIQYYNKQIKQWTANQRIKKFYPFFINRFSKNFCNKNFNCCLVFSECFKRFGNVGIIWHKNYKKLFFLKYKCCKKWRWCRFRSFFDFRDGKHFDALFCGLLFLLLIGICHLKGILKGFLMPY